MVKIRKKIIIGIGMYPFILTMKQYHIIIIYLYCMIYSGKGFFRSPVIKLRGGVASQASDDILGTSRIPSLQKRSITVT